MRSGLRRHDSRSGATAGLNERSVAMSGVHLLSETTLSGHSTLYKMNGTSSMSRCQDQIRPVISPRPPKSVSSRVAAEGAASSVLTREDQIEGGMGVEGACIPSAAIHRWQYGLGPAAVHARRRTPQKSGFLVSAARTNWQRCRLRPAQAQPGVLTEWSPVACGTNTGFVFRHSKSGRTIASSVFDEGTETHSDGSTT